MSVEDYDHRWEPLAEINFSIDDDDENYIYCLCSRVFLRDGLKPYITEKEEESDMEEQVVKEVDSQSHVHFSAEISEKYKLEKEETASCYCSASHTDNCCSTDEHDPSQHQVEPALQPSDSGADLTYQENLADLDKPETMEQDAPLDPNIPIENYLLEDSWEKFWANNGERLIWASWISKYSDYINPAYLQENNDLVEETNISRDYSADQLYKEDNEVEVRERSLSYDSKVNPYKKAKGLSFEKSDKIVDSTCNKDDNWLPVRKRSMSEHERIKSPKTLASDSMTNVTKMTFSSYEVTSSRITSDSSPTEDYSISSASDDQNEQTTKIANIDDNPEIPIEEMDTDQYWQFLWKQHFGEHYALHYAKYIEEHNQQQNKLNETTSKAQAISIEQVENQMNDISINEKSNRPKRKKKSRNMYLGSVGVLLQNLIKEESEKTEPVDAGDEANKDKIPATDSSKTTNDEVKNVIPSSTNFNTNRKEDDEEDPPDEAPVNLKRSHEMDYEEMASEKIKSTFDMMGLFFHPEATTKGQLVYRKKPSRLRPPWLKRFASRKKTYFDDDGFPCSSEQGKPNDSQDDADMQTDNESPRANLTTDDQQPNEENKETDKILQSKGELQQSAINNYEEKEALNSSISDVLDTDKNSNEDEAVDNDVTCEVNMSKRRRRRRKRSLPDDVEMPAELVANPKLKKYWKKRHSLFLKYDSGIRLDVESWFSVTPEKVARHIAERCRCDLVVDAFCGAGGNTIQLAMTCERVIAIDIDPLKIELARHNCEVYGVADRVEFIVGDLFSVAHRLIADVVFLSPPWGGPTYTLNNDYDLESMLEPKPVTELMDVAKAITHNIALYVPRNSRTDQLVSLAKTSGAVEIEQNFLGKRFVALTAYYGDLVN